MMAVQVGGSAPYTAFAALRTVIERYRDRGLTVPFTSEVLARAGVSETLTQRTLQSLQTLDLIDESGRPTSALDGLRLAPESEFPERLAEIVRGAYADVFQYVDPSTSDAQRVHDAFRGYTPASQRDRMVSLFLRLCEWAGIVEEPPKRTPGPRRQPATGKGGPIPKSGPQKPRATHPKPEDEKGSNGGAHRSGGLFGITEDDFSILNDDEIDTVWQALGTIVKAKARAQRDRAEALGDEGKADQDATEE
jgi:hypothetical protein